MKVSEIKRGDLIFLENDQNDWAIDDYECKMKLDDLASNKGFSVGEERDGWSSHHSSLSRKSFLAKRTKINVASKQDIPAVEFRFKVATVVLPYQRMWMKGMFKSHAVYLGSKRDPFTWEGANLHHRILLNGSVCLISSYMFRFLEKAE